MMRKAPNLLVALVAVTGVTHGRAECEEHGSCVVSGTAGQALLQNAAVLKKSAMDGDKYGNKKIGDQDDEEYYYFEPGEDYSGDEEEVEEPAWVKAVPDGMNKIENWNKDDCQRKCMDMGQGNGVGKGLCDYCGKGNACCKWNDPQAPTECSGVAEEPFKDEWGFVQQLKMRCVYPKASNVSNYQKYKDEAWAAAMKILGGGHPQATHMSQFSAPDVDVEGYQKFEGKGKPEYFLGVPAEKDDTLQAECSAFGNQDYALSNTGLFDDMTYYKYPYWTVSGGSIEISLFCGARYTDDPSEKTQKAAAEMARKACDGMGDKCGGYSVGADPECCGNTGCTEVVFLGSGAAFALGGEESMVVDKAPQSFKTGQYQCNYATYIKSAADVLQKPTMVADKYSNKKIGDLDVPQKPAMDGDKYGNKKIGDQDDEEYYYFEPGEDYSGDEEEVEEPAWVKAVPDGMNKIENWNKDDCQRKCMDMGQGNGVGKGLCDYCGKGNACCKWNDPQAPTECSGVAEEPFKDEWGFVQQLKMRCVYPKASNVSNYQKYKDEAWAAAMKILGGGHPQAIHMSQFSAPDVDVEGYQKFEGKGKPEYFLGVPAEKDDTLQAECSAFGNQDYALSNTGLFDDMTYYKYPYWTVSGGSIEINLFCGARYTDDPSEKTQKAAAEMARKACDGMGDKCGGYSVGADPECCGNTGCTEVVFLGPGAASALGGDETKVLDKAPQSFKTGKYQCNYATYIKR